MPRNPSTGGYSKPAGTTPAVGQVIDPAPWNALTTDLGNEVTNSLPRDGSAPMIAPLKAASGTVSAPGIGFATNPQTGLYLKGGGLLGFTQNGVDVGFDKARFMRRSQAITRRWRPTTMRFIASPRRRRSP